MRWSIPIGRLFGVQVRIHATFPLLLLYVAGMEMQGDGDLQKAIKGLIVVLSIFACVVLHEFGHVLAARQFGCRTRDVTLLPIGGVASMERIPEEPLQELWVAVAGPLVNVAIALGLVVLLGIKMTLTPGMLTGASFLTANLPESLLYANIFMVLFNLLPAFPMDGGRVLRALLALRMNHVRATQMAAKVGRIMAVLFVATGVVIPAPQLLLVGVFVWIGAGSEASSVTLRALLKNVAVRAAMLTDFKTVSPFDTLSETATLVLAGSQKDFPVTNQGHLLGVLTHSNLIGALQSRGGETLVSESMDREFMTASPGEPLEAVLARCSPGNPSGLAVPVLDGERLVGLLTPEHVSELLMIRQALASHISNSQPR